MGKGLQNPLPSGTGRLRQPFLGKRDPSLVVAEDIGPDRHAQAFLAPVIRTELAQTESRLKEYRRLVEEAQAEVEALARINYRLDARNRELEELLRIRDGVIEQLQKQVNSPKKGVVRNIKNVDNA